MYQQLWVQLHDQITKNCAKEDCKNKNSHVALVLVAFDSAQPLLSSLHAERRKSGREVTYVDILDLLRGLREVYTTANFDEEAMSVINF